MTATAALVHTIVALALVVSLLRGRHHALWMVGFVGPLQGLRVEVAGVGWQWARVLPLLLMLAYVLHVPRADLPRRRFPGGAMLGALIVWMVLVTGFFFLFDADTAHLLERAQRMGWGSAQTTLRHPLQFAVVLSYFGSAYLVAKLVSGQRDLHSLVSGFIAANLVSVVFGAYQLLAVEAGLPVVEILPENVLVEQIDHEARLYGLSGEPKHTGACAVLALALLLSIQIAGRRAAAPTWKIVVLLSGIAMTRSTSAFVGVLMLLSVLYLLSLIRGEGRTLRRYIFTGLMLTGLLMLLAQSQVSQVVDERIGARLFQGADTIGYFEPKDGAYVSHIQSSPGYLVTGHGAGGVDFHLIDHFRRDLLPEMRSITPTYTLTRTLADVGLVGLLLILGMLAAWWRAARATITPSVGGTFIVLGGSAMLVAPFLVFILYLMIAGAFVGYYCSQPLAVPAVE